MVGLQDDIPPPPPPSQTPTQQTPHTVSTIKLPILKKGEYDIWAMKMEHYLDHTDYPISEVIQNGNGLVSISTDTQEDHLAKFHKMTDAKEMWEAIKSRFGGNDESKKMQKYILKQQFEGFSVSNSEGLHKGYDRFQSLLSQLEIHGAGISTEDANQKFLRSLPSAWSQVSLIMRTKPGVDSLSFDDLYNNLRVFENDVKGSTASSSSTQNVAFVSENTSSTNDVSTAYGVSNPSGHNSQYEQTSSYSLLANQSSCPQLDHEDLEQLDEFDLEEMDLKWQVAMISMRMKKFYKKTGRKLQFDAKEPVGFDKTKVECYSCHKTRHFAKECRSKGNQDGRRIDAWNSGNKDKENGRRSGKQEDSKALVSIDGEGSDTKVNSCSKECKESYAELKKLYDEQRAQLSDASIEILAYTRALKKFEVQLVAHQQSQLWYKEKIRFIKIDLDDKTDVLTYHKRLLAEAEKEKEDLKAKVEKWHNSSKYLSKLLNTQMSANDKFGLGYGDFIYDGILSYENEILQSVFMNKESDLENQPLYDRFVTAEGMHVVPPPMTGNYMPSGPDIEIDYSQFTYGPKQSQTSKSESQTSDFDTYESNCNDEIHESLPEPVVNEPKVVSQPKVWSDAPIIEEYESDSEDEHVSLPIEEQETPSFANKQVKTPRETVKNQFTHSKNPKVDKKGLGYGFTIKACFVCGSLSHLIRYCDFHEKRMAKQAELNNRMRKKSSQREIRPIWNNVQRVNHKNQFVPTTVLTRTGKILVNTVRTSGTNIVNTSRHNFNKQAVPTNAAIKVNNVKPIVNNARPKGDFLKFVSPFRNPYGGLSFTDLTNPDQNDSKIHALEEIYANPTDGIIINSSYDDEGAVADFTNLEPVVNVSPIPTSRINSIHPSTLILRDPQSAVQTRSKVTKSSGAHAFKISEALEDKSWVDAMQEELLQFKIQKVWILIDLPYGKKAIGTKWMDCEKCPSCMGKLMRRSMWSNLPGFIDPKYPKKVYKVVKALYGLHQAPRAWYATLSTFLLKNGYRRGTIDKTLFIKKEKSNIMLMSSMGELTFFLGLQVKQKEDGIFISQDKYVVEILKKFDFVSVKTASTPIETQKPLVKDEEASDVDVHLYRSMIGSLMYLTASRPDIMFAVCACSRFQVTQKTSHLNAVKKIFRYLKGKPKLGLWYPRVSSFDLEAYSDSDYAGANLDRKSTTGGCQFLGRDYLLAIKKQTIVATSTTEAEYVAAANCYGQVLWIQNQMLDYGFNFMNTKIYIDNESTICIVKNPVYHSKTKHIAYYGHLFVSVLGCFRDLLGRALDGTEALLLPKLFILWLAKVSTDSANLVPLGKDSTAIETLKKIPPRV
ncbi:ribonuclease H-like domain-containing protein [Tanacetum coccineum]